MFLRSNITNRTWSYFFSFASMSIQRLSLRETILTWWNEDIRKLEKAFFRLFLILSSENYRGEEIASSMKEKYHRVEDDIQHYKKSENIVESKKTKSGIFL